MQSARVSKAPMIEFQKVIDNILAFWGIVDDWIEDENTRNIIKIGKRVERIDLYGRLHAGYESMRREICRLTGRIDRCNIHYRKDVLDRLNKLIQEKPLNYPEIVKEIEQILEV